MPLVKRGYDGKRGWFIRQNRAYELSYS